MQAMSAEVSGSLVGLDVQYGGKVREASESVAAVLGCRVGSGGGGGGGGEIREGSVDCCSWGGLEWDCCRRGDNARDSKGRGVVVLGVVVLGVGDGSECARAEAGAEGKAERGDC